MSLRNNAVLIFDSYGLSAQHFESKYDREKVGKIRELLGCIINPIKKSTEYAQIPPVICKDDDPSNVSKRFLNPVLFKVRHIAIFFDTNVVYLVHNLTGRLWCHFWQNCYQLKICCSRPCN